jgi:hypothetical protein
MAAWHGGGVSASMAWQYGIRKWRGEMSATAAKNGIRISKRKRENGGISVEEPARRRSRKSAWHDVMAASAWQAISSAAIIGIKA